MKKLNKKEFKKRIKDNVRTLYRKNLEEASEQQIFQAVAYSVKDIIIDDWMASQQQFEQDDPKMVVFAAAQAEKSKLLHRIAPVQIYAEPFHHIINFHRIFRFIIFLVH